MAEDLMEFLRPPELPLLNEQELRLFVLGVVDGQVFTSAHIRPDEMTTTMVVVFMGLMAGVEPKIGWHVPEKPSGLTPLEPPKDKKHPEEPKPTPSHLQEPELKEASGLHIEELEFRIRWGRSPKTAVDDYRAKVAAENEEAEAKYRAKLKAWQDKNGGSVEEWKATCEEVDASNMEGWKKYESTLADHKVQEAAAILLMGEWEALYERWRAEYAEQIGVVYEWMGEAGPRSVNGYPTFQSTRLLHRDDWERVKVAIDREQDRRKTIEV